ncbi:AraC-like DNA-binding protein [Catenuloplanes nepalensis]|uniref:AraC-like DNA-binding protein n=1 Tax=Catenuloplanes nepalensis TaxID=587533 RepID=A0ABT9MT97_9ACTN|nr:AraC family transcriptional regulator [Catenuloplanes nepalensis]MDP9794662.1 AraC-like DNA-binding protein [Catenuloplanes nepalensis]
MRPGDPLSEVLDLVDVRGVVSGGAAVSGAWVSPELDMSSALKFMAVVRGGMRVYAGGLDTPIELAAGDVAVLNHRDRVRLESVTPDSLPRRTIHEVDVDDDVVALFGSAQDADDIMVGGHVDLNPAGHALLAPVLPPVAHVRASAAAATGVRRILDRLFEELLADRAGSTFAMRQYGQLFVLELMRAYMHQAELPPGWLRVSIDEQLRPTLALMHGEPARRPSVDELARAASMSRTSFAERFRAVAGMPPIAYMSRWRMLHAQRALRDSDVGVGTLASHLGYASESAFSTAFKREIGESPLRFRQRLRRAMA